MELNKDNIAKNLEIANHKHKEVMFEHKKTDDLLAKNILKINKFKDEIESLFETKLDKNFFSTGLTDVNNKIEKN